MRQSLIYKTQDGREPYTEFLEDLKDRRAVAKIRTRIVRAELGNLGDHRAAGHGVIELKIDFGPGYRVSIALEGHLMVILCAGDKSTQSGDIRNSHGFWENFRTGNRE